MGWAKEDYVEYDLDNEDEEWLEAFNAGHVRLTGDKLERLLWRLETANAEANQRVMGEPGAWRWRCWCMCVWGRGDEKGEPGIIGGERRARRAQGGDRSSCVRRPPACLPTCLHVLLHLSTAHRPAAWQAARPCAACP